MAKSFSAQVDAWTRKASRRIEFVLKASAQELFETAQQTIPKGGALPFDIGFLRASFAAKIGAMPSGPTSPDEPYRTDWEGPVALTIANWEPGEDLNAGWTAVYARPMEERYGFMKTSAMQWQSIVTGNVALAKRAIR